MHEAATVVEMTAASSSSTTATGNHTSNAEEDETNALLAVAMMNSVKEGLGSAMLQHLWSSMAAVSKQQP